MKDRLSKLARAFTLAAAMIGLSTAANVQPVHAAVSENGYPVETDSCHPPGGRQAQFDDFAALPPSWQALLYQSNHILGYENLAGRDLYESLDDCLRAGLLNVMAKSDATVLNDHSTVLDHIREITVVHQDRFFGLADAILQDKMNQNLSGNLFYERSKLGSSLHHTILNYQKTGSYKTYDENGNLDITLSSNDHNWRVEIDVDEWKGLQHAFREVLWHHSFRKLTNPFNVEKILTEKQKIDTHYRIVPKGKAPENH